jgi:hypothetical protein
MANVRGAERKSWNFGNFGTRHDGRKWRLVRIKNTDGTDADGSKVLASNKSATPLVNLARELSRVEKRDLKINKLRAQVATLSAQLNELQEAVVAEAAALTESNDSDVIETEDADSNEEAV